jgi:hypothetical protein
MDNCPIGGIPKNSMEVPKKASKYFLVKDLFMKVNKS